MDLDPIVTRSIYCLGAWLTATAARDRYLVANTPTARRHSVSDSRVTVVIPAKDEEGLIGEIVDAVKPFSSAAE